jgi:hypothetical protein
MSTELCAAIAELTADRPYTTQNELYERYFRNADWERFKWALSTLGLEGLVFNRPHPQIPGDRLIALTEVGKALPLRRRAIERGRRRRGEIPQP